MLLKRNLLENLMILSSSGTIFCVLLNYVTNISLITGIWFPLYIVTWFIISVLISFKSIQWLLQQNKPLKYDLDDFVKRYPYLAFVKVYLPVIKKPEPPEWKEYDTNELSVISTVLERNLVSSWYVPYVSQDIGFPFACKQILDQMIGNAFKIAHKIETKDVFVDMCTILITHFKEYKKALKRQEKSPDTPIETFYKTSHAVSDPNKKYSTADHCTNVVRILMKELVPYELWDTPQAELLVRILSKRLDEYIEDTLANPDWINDRIVTYLTGEEYIAPEQANDEKNAEITTELPEKSDKEAATEPVTFQVEVAEDITPPQDESTVKMDSIVEELPVNMTSPVDVKSSPVLRQRRGRQGRNEVKIYDRIIEGSVKTWETDMDLQCISLGQDLLASLDGEITLSRLWGQDGETESSPERGGRSPQPLWFGEEEALELENCTERTHSPKAADMLKELSSTVSHAKTKIGDLQDEAAGMMEGLLDFGIAGLKKGLRFTGLSDDSQDKSPSHREKGDKSPTEMKHKPFPESAPVALQKESENAAVPHLVKQHRVPSQDSVPLPSRTAEVAPRGVEATQRGVEATPLGVEAAGSGAESPEPEYEEAADLSSSIAKLRCLLAQQQNQYKDEGVWWERAEETRGRTLLHSTRRVDTATLADEYDMSMDRASPNQTNNMQRLDKLFHRTVTGVFNSLKTAVGGEESAAAPSSDGDWRFVCGAREAGGGGAAARLLAAARRQPRPAHAPLRTKLATHSATHDADDLEEYCGVWSGAVGAVSAASPVPHAAAAIATLLLHDIVESVVCGWLVEAGSALRRRAFRCGEARAAPPAARRPRDPRATELLLMERTTALQAVVGERWVQAGVRVAVHSVAHRALARDIAHRALDALLVHARAQHA